jgi:ammonia channel protein AmtB
MTVLLAIHNIMRWIVLLTGLLALITGLRGIGGGRNFTNGDKRTALYFLIAADIQLLLGFALYFINGYYRNFSAGMGEVMKVPATRFWTVEHPVGMLLAIIFAHVAYASTKGDRAHRAKFRRLFMFSLLSLVLMAATIPWPGRAGIGRPLVPSLDPAATTDAAPAMTTDSTVR